MHFTTIVFGEDVEKQMAKYDENLRVFPFLERIDDKEIELARKNLLKKRVENPTPDDFEKEYFNIKVLEFEGEYYQVSKYNPNSQWDWYSVGGRWVDFFPLKKNKIRELKYSRVFMSESEYEYADVVKLKDIDFHKARATARKKALKEFLEWEEILKKYGKPKGWSEVDEKGFKVKRETYLSQPAISNYVKINHRDPVEKFGFDRDDYLDKVNDNVLVPYAYVINGEWHEKKVLKLTDSKKVQDDWNKQYNEFLRTVDPETTLTLLDCHI